MVAQKFLESFIRLILILRLNDKLGDGLESFIKNGYFIIIFKMPAAYYYYRQRGGWPPKARGPGQGNSCP